MKAQSIKEQSRQWEEALNQAAQGVVCLRLYVSGTTPKSTTAITNIKSICESHLKGRYKLEVVDIYQQPSLAKGEQIVAAPTLIKTSPLPVRKFIGDMSNSGRILVGLDVRPVKPSREARGKARRS
ncbi:MAG: KaiB protein [Verrucomicrobiales bacterium]|jgi:circadian clock protein KaiB|nr:KaiB protein [Verrucomicrobiales bacterium]